MKTLITLLVVFTLSASAIAQQPSGDEIKKTSAYLRFKPSEVNMGKINVDKVTDDTGNIDIEVFNDGALPLILNQVTACCGTTVKDWPKAPITPGQKGIIKVSFRVMPTPQRISRTVTVQSNAGNGNIQKVAILGEVVVPTNEKEIKLPR